MSLFPDPYEEKEVAHFREKEDKMEEEHPKTSDNSMEANTNSLIDERNVLMRLAKLESDVASGLQRLSDRLQKLENVLQDNGDKKKKIKEDAEDGSWAGAADRFFKDAFKHYKFFELSPFSEPRILERRLKEYLPENFHNKINQIVEANEWEKKKSNLSNQRSEFAKKVKDNLVNLLGLTREDFPKLIPQVKKGSNQEKLRLNKEIDEKNEEILNTWKGRFRTILENSDFWKENELQWDPAMTALDKKVREHVFANTRTTKSDVAYLRTIEYCLMNGKWSMKSSQKDSKLIQLYKDFLEKVKPEEFNQTIMEEEVDPNKKEEEGTLEGLVEGIIQIEANENSVKGKTKRKRRKKSETHEDNSTEDEEEETAKKSPKKKTS